MEKNTISLTHKSGYTYQSSRITNEDAKVLIEKFDGVILEIFTDKINDSGQKVYLLNDDRVVENYHYGAELISSLKGFLLGQQDAMKWRKRIPKKLPIKRIIPSQDFKGISYHEIDFDEAEEKITFHLQEVKFNPNSKDPIYYLATGEVITHYYNDIYKLFQSNKDFEYLKYYYSKHHPYLFGLNPYGKEFPNHVDELINRLSKMLNIEKEKLDYSRRSFFLLTDSIYENMIDDEFKMNTYLPLLAYIGQCSIKILSDKWIMTYDSNFDTWTPELKSETNENEKYYHRLYSILDSHDDHYLPLLTAVSTTLLKKLKEIEEAQKKQ